MKDRLQKLLDRHLPIAGVAAWSARLPDRTLLSHCFTDWFTPPQLEQALTRLLLAADTLARDRLKPARLCWTFEHARVHLALRPDGASLTFFAENRPGVSAGAIESALEAFVRLA